MAAEPLRDVAALLDIYRQGLVFHCLSAVSRLSIPDRMADGRRDIAELAAETGTDEDALRRVLVLLAGSGVVDVDADRSSAELTAQGRVLTRRHPMSLWATFATFGIPDVGNALTATLKDGGPATRHALGVDFWEHLAKHPDQQLLFGEAMAEQARLLTLPCVPLLDWPADGTVADVAGGIGVLLADVLDEAPGARGILVDQPEVLGRARAYLAEQGVDDRCTVRTGDLFAPPPPADVYVLSRVLHDWDDDSVAAILDAVRRGGDGTAVLRIFEDVLPDDAVPSALQGWADVAMLALYHRARERTLPEFRRLLERAGWRFERVVQGPPGMCVIEARPIPAA
ncbi:methyltransferase [Streptomyces sp. NPDC048518]|uniref:methyltransferase n=1 Tax=Streptomyces sp. NPDC048518 TaxID=3155029 RepID=UPI003406CEDD